MSPLKVEYVHSISSSVGMALIRHQKEAKQGDYCRTLSMMSLSILLSYLFMSSF